MRPQLEIKEGHVQKLAEMQCTDTEIAAFFECSRKTIKSRFSAIIEQGREKGKISLRRMQFKAAEEGNGAMLIWLGKQYLGQMDKMEIDAGDTHFIMTLKGPGQDNGQGEGGNGEVKQIEGEVVPDGDQGTEDGDD